MRSPFFSTPCSGPCCITINWIIPFTTLSDQSGEFHTDKHSTLHKHLVPFWECEEAIKSSENNWSLLTSTNLPHIFSFSYSCQVCEGSRCFLIYILISWTYKATKKLILWIMYKCFKKKKSSKNQSWIWAFLPQDQTKVWRV